MTNHVIPEAAAEAAVSANYEARTGKRWSNAPSGEQAIERSWMRRALEAAAPHMLGDLLGALDAVRALVYDNTLADGCVMHAINPEAIRSALGDNPHRETGITIKREVEVEDGREHVWWTVVDRESGYNKTFRTEEEAKAHAAVLTNPYRSQS